MISSLCMVGGAALALTMTWIGITIAEQLLAGVALCVVTSLIARRLYREEHLPSVYQA